MWTYVFISLGYIPMNRISGLYGNSVLTEELLDFFFFFFLRFYLFIFRESRREGERETGDQATTQACTLTGNRTRDL